RHTRSKRDWSSDVCSSDLGIGRSKRSELQTDPLRWELSRAEEMRPATPHLPPKTLETSSPPASPSARSGVMAVLAAIAQSAATRSEERRVGKECRSRWVTY